MLAHLFAAFEFSVSEFAVPMVAGLTGGALSFIAARYFTGQSNKHQRPTNDVSPLPAGDPFETGSSTEKRLAYRRKGSHVEIFIERADKPKRPFTGWVVDRSVSGVRILVDRPVDNDTTLNILPVNAPSVAPWVAVVVKNCRETEKGWEIGCHFPKQPPWAILLQFG